MKKNSNVRSKIWTSSGGDWWGGVMAKSGGENTYISIFLEMCLAARKSCRVPDDLGKAMIVP